MPLRQGYKDTRMQEYTMIHKDTRIHNDTMFQRYKITMIQGYNNARKIR